MAFAARAAESAPPKARRGARQGYLLWVPATEDEDEPDITAARHQMTGLFESVPGSCESPDNRQGASSSGETPPLPPHNERRVPSPPHAATADRASWSTATALAFSSIGAGACAPVGIDVAGVRHSMGA